MTKTIPPPSLGKKVKSKKKAVTGFIPSSADWDTWKSLMTSVLSIEMYHRLKWKHKGYQKIRALGYGTQAHFNIKVYGTLDGRWFKAIIVNTKKTEYKDWIEMLNKQEWQRFTVT